MVRRPRFTRVSDGKPLRRLLISSKGERFLWVCLLSCRYQCSTRRHHGDCKQAIVKAEPLEEQLVTWLHAFNPDEKLRNLVLDTIRSATQQDPSKDQARRRDLLTQLARLQDLYVLGDLTKPRYIMRRQTLEEELQRLAPPTDPRASAARRLRQLLAGRDQPRRAAQARGEPV